MTVLRKKPWWVWDNFGRLLGTVWAERKFQACFLAERDLGAVSGGYHVGRAD